MGNFFSTPDNSPLLKKNSIIELIFIPTYQNLNTNEIVNNYTDKITLNKNEKIMKNHIQTTFNTSKGNEEYYPFFNNSNFKLQNLKINKNNDVIAIGKLSIKNNRNFTENQVKNEIKEIFLDTEGATEHFYSKKYYITIGKIKDIYFK